MSDDIDWVDWHRSYNQSDSSLSRRLSLIRTRFGEELDRRSGPLRVISMCAGQGLDVLPVLAESAHRDDTDVLLVELHPELAASAARTAHSLGLQRVRVICGDAAFTDNYLTTIPADIIVACGVFGNVSLPDAEQIIKAFPTLGAAGCSVIWNGGYFNSGAPRPEVFGLRRAARRVYTAGSRLWRRVRRIEPSAEDWPHWEDFSPLLRRWFADAGFEELAFDAPARDRFRVGVHRLKSPPSEFLAGRSLFQFRT